VEEKKKQESRAVARRTRDATTIINL